MILFPWLWVVVMGVFRVRFKVKTNPKMNHEPKGQCKPQSYSGYARCRYYGPVSGVDKPKRSLSCSRSTHQWRSLGGRGYSYPQRIAEGGAQNHLIRNASHCQTWTHIVIQLTGNYVMKYDWTFHFGSPKLGPFRTKPGRWL